MFEGEEKDRGSLVNNHGMFVNELKQCLQASPLRDRDLGVHPKEIVQYVLQARDWRVEHF